MNKTNKLLLIVLLIGFACQQNKPKQEEKPEAPIKSTPTLSKLWETDTVLTTAESVIYDAERDVLYVSNISGVPPLRKDDDGFISKVSTTGEIIELNWVTGISAPKGMGIFGGILYVTNIDEMVKINIETGEVAERISVEGTSFLNDIDIDADGNVYFSDSNTNKIHLLSASGEVSVWAENESFGNPNGLLHLGDRLMLASFGSGQFHTIDLASKMPTMLCDSIPGGDGVVSYGEDYLVSNWGGEVYHVTTTGVRTKILDTKEAGFNAADIAMIADKNILLVPTFFGNTVAAYEIK